MRNPLSLEPIPMTEREAYARLGWRIEGGLGESGLNKLILPCSEPESDSEVWLVVQCEPCGLTGTCRIGAIPFGCGVCNKPFTRIIGK